MRRLRGKVAEGLQVCSLSALRTPARASGSGSDGAGWEGGQRELGGEDEFVVVGSDGLWGVLSNSEAVSVVAATVKHVDFGPQRLVSTAYEAGSDDNITALVVYLRAPH